MPLNEINAPVYIKGKYSTPAYPKGHAFRLYFELGSAFVGGLVGDESNWRLEHLGDDVGSVSGIVDNLFDRAGTWLPENSHILELELWQSIIGDNILMHLNTLPIGNSYGSGAGVASSFTMSVFAGPLRQPYRFTWFDGGSASPQRFAPQETPPVDNNTVAWYFLKSNVPFATNDGVRLTVQKSWSTGYNRKLAKTYGKSVSP